MDTPTGLNYDGRQDNGVVFNEAYPYGALFVGKKNKPQLSFPYFSFEYHPSANLSFVVDENGRRPLEDNEISEIQNLISTWEQPLGQEGNPSDLVVEVAVSNGGSYNKHTLHGSTEGAGEIRGLSYLDVTYNHRYYIQSSLLEFSSPRVGGTKKYQRFNQYSKRPNLGVLEPHKSDLFMKGVDTGSSSAELYFGLSNEAEVIDLADLTDLPNPFSEEQFDLLATNPRVYGTGGTAKPFAVSVRVAPDGTFSDLTGFITLGPEEILSMFNIDNTTWVAPPLPIHTISPRQTRLALLQLGKLGEVQTAFESLPVEQQEWAQIEWEYATEIERYSPFVQQLAPALGLTEEQTDELFRTASTL